MKDEPVVANLKTTSAFVQSVWNFIVYLAKYLKGFTLKFEGETHLVPGPKEAVNKNLQFSGFWGFKIDNERGAIPDPSRLLDKMVDLEGGEEEGSSLELPVPTSTESPSPEF